MKPSSAPRRSVTIFGAGVAGLTAAHELVERGFDVEVIDPDIREEIHTFTRDRGIGGMARSQWGCWLDALARPPEHDPGIRPPPRLRDGDDLLVNDVIVFDEERVAPIDTDEADRVLTQAARLIERLVRVDEEIDLARAGELTIMAPRAGQDGAPAPPAADARVEWVRAELRQKIGPELSGAIDHVHVTFPDPARLELPQQQPSSSMERWVFFVFQNLRILPAEHGFRFFPSFYRHLFDTLKRIPIVHPLPYERTRGTVKENLVPSDGLGFARARAVNSFMIERRDTRSIEKTIRTIRLVLSELEYSFSDMDRFGLKLFKYLTSSIARRAGEYEDLSWGRFVEQHRYSPVSRRHIEFGPQMSAALRGSLSDTRTQGTISVQLVMDQFKTDGEPDCTLNGPTSPAWLDHWHDYLSIQGVRFRRGALVDFHVVDGEVLPRVVRRFRRDEHGESAPDLSTEIPVRGDLFVLALSLPAAAKVAKKLLDVARPPPGNDFERILAFAGDVDENLKQAAPDGPLQHLSGIQYYFDVELEFWRGHTQYLDSEWGLTSIAQPQFWGRARDVVDGYRSIISVDIGIWDRKYKGKTAWECTPDEIAAYAWEQIADHHDDAFRERYGPNQVIPRPSAYAIDANIVFGTPKTDKTPFLVNRVRAYRTRPGKLVPEGTSKQISAYEVYLGKYILAGTFMKTFTRLTSMEGANESARHAVNALLTAAQVPGDHCEIWDPEDNEIADLQWLRDLDERRYREGKPHFTDTLGCDGLSDLDPSRVLLALV